MPGNPKECREHARCCLEHAAAATSPLVKDNFLTLAQTWRPSCARARSKQEISGGFGGRVPCQEAFTAARASSLKSAGLSFWASASVGGLFIGSNPPRGASKSWVGFASLYSASVSDAAIIAAAVSFLKRTSIHSNLESPASTSASRSSMRPPPISILPSFRCARSCRCKAVLARIICSISCSGVFMALRAPFTRLIQEAAYSSGGGAFATPIWPCMSPPPLHEPDGMITQIRKARQARPCDDPNQVQINICEDDAPHVSRSQHVRVKE